MAPSVIVGIVNVLTGADDDALIKPVTGPLVMDWGPRTGNRIINYDVNIINSHNFVRLFYFDAASHQLVSVANGTWLGGHTHPPLSDPACSPWDNSTANCGYSGRLGSSHVHGQGQG
jgi:hypothetical protein